MAVKQKQVLARLNRYKFDYLGAWEFAEVLGITKQALHNRKIRGKLPEAQELRMGPVWSKKQVMIYAVHEYLKSKL